LIGPLEYGIFFIGQLYEPFYTKIWHFFMTEHGSANKTKKYSI